MNNDDIKKFIDLTNLYTEVEINKSEKLDEGFLDWIKNIVNPDDVDKVETAIGDLDSNVVNKLDDVADEIDTTVTTQAQANSIFQDPDATAAQRKAAQDFYNANKDDGGVAQGQDNNPNTDGGQARTTSDGPQVDTDAGGNAQANISQNDTSTSTSGQDNNPNTDGGAGPTTRPNNQPADADPESTGPTTRPNNRPADDTPKITAEIQAELVKRGLDRGIIGEPLTPEDIAALKQPAPPAANPKVAARDAADAAIDNKMDRDNEVAGAGAEPATPGNATDDGGLGQRPAPTAQAPQDELDATDTAQTGTGAPVQPNPNEVNRDAPDTAQPNAAAMAAGQAGAASTTAPSNGSLLGRKLDITTPNLMKAYNDGGKQSMPAVRNMQTALSRLGFDPNGLDGKYGPGTFKAVQEFQKANGLPVDGQAGPSTMAAIKKALDDNFENNKVTPADTAQAAAPTAQAAAPTTQTASKDNNMNKNKINEASMNISMNGNDASEVADLVKLLQNAGMPQASPVSDIPMPNALHTPHDHDSHDNMKSMMTLMSEPEDTPCGEDCGCDSCATEDTSEYDAVVSEWDNSPEEEYSGVSAVIPDGDDLHKSKKPYPAVDGGDNAMALESIKETLWAALQEKTTIEGSRGKKSRGKKSRG